MKKELYMEHKMSTEKQYFTLQEVTVQRDRIAKVATPLGDIEIEVTPPEHGDSRKLTFKLPPLMRAFKREHKRPGDDVVPRLVEFDKELGKNIVKKDFVQLLKGIDGELIGLEEPAPITIREGE